MAGSRVISAVLTLRDRNFASTATSAANSTRDLERRVMSTRNAVSRFGQSATSSFSNVAKSTLGLVAAYAGVTAIKDLGVSMVESAASAQAMSAQFSTVFGDMEGKATESLEGIATETNALSGRLKGTFLGIAAFAKTSGMDTASALALTERATLAAADSAAFYDRSLEDVSENLQSFLKGNYENDAALGIAATETTRNAVANKLYSKSFKDLDESQKQLALLQMVEDGNKLSGALGQAAREGDGFENIMGNMAESWNLLKVKFGTPILGPVIKGLQFLTSAMLEVDTDKLVDRMVNFGSSVKGVFDKMKPTISWIKDTAFPGIKDEIIDMYTAIQPGLNWMKDTAFPAIADTIVFVVDSATSMYNFFKNNWSGIGPIIVGVATAVSVFRLGILAITTAKTIWAGVTTGVTIATAILNGTLALSPFGWVALAIGAVVTVALLLYKNWELVRSKTAELWDKLGAFKGVAVLVLGPIGQIIRTAVTMAENWDNTRSVWENVWNGIKLSASNAVNDVIGSVNSLIGIINKIPGVSIPIVPKVDWGATKTVTAKPVSLPAAFSKQPTSTSPRIMTSIPKNPYMSHATGLERVPFDNYKANLHEDESVLTAKQSNALRNEGILKSNSNGTPTLNMKSMGTDQPSKNNNNINIHINGVNKSTNEIINELVPQLKLRLANM
ncbi:hypothetical protein [Peribacillus loiseleuriae]|uniref:hypothetical protein n=1 Tax=Peribacillus loiseleuriae TaxID=1679170 RepID=UPI003D06976F